MGLLMTYKALKNETFEESFETMQNGEAEENWADFQELLGSEQDVLDIDKSWNLLGIIFENSEVGNFIWGKSDNMFELEEVTICVFSKNYLEFVIDFIKKEKLLDKNIFINYCKLNNEFSETTDSDYYFEKFEKIINFYQNAIKNKNWVMGELM